ncbi:Gfo/Idh/MocA family protein [Tautonia plasticadhaerens]|uniref:Putative oxidoreductase YcjS n=1 Tax=Tautonia plasticadhaerens TaxID=2527974 RepID=A0A518H1L6_9BACT|nr:Gfo/Idh/MocA family oxidoreductase [Tautonia plasticadhaerens]QDV34726.1 putative oxidoreductase YcjS [Tautonia plasticadhaerens]
MTPLRFAAFGAGFWARYQLAAWREVPGAKCVALCDPDRAKAEALAAEAGVPAVYDDPATLLDREAPDFIDVITGVDSHPPLVLMAAERGIPAICQKPMAASYGEAERMVSACREAGVPLLIHENWRWQGAIRAFKAVLDSGRIGRPFRARIDFITGFPVFDNQPALRELDQFILTDIGTHILDAARFLFGEAEGLMALTRRVHEDIRGEDVASVMLAMQGGAIVSCNMAYAGNPLEVDRFPETFVAVEADRGSARLDPDFWIRETTAEGTFSRRCPPARFPWADPSYDAAHASMVPCLADLLAHLGGGRRAETTGEDNLRTLRLVFESYRSAAERRFITLA